MKIYLAPMEGVVDPIIREIYSKIGGYDQMVTEFVRITSTLHSAKIYHRYSPELKNNGKTKYGTPVYIQLLGSNKELLAENALLACELGAPGIDLNFGCPAKTVNRHDGGATLLKDPQRIFDIISYMRKRLPENIPLTAKVRLGFSDKSKCKDIAKAVDQGGAARLTIHARTRAEGYKPPAHWEYIAEMKSVVKSAEVVANGDLWNYQNFLRCKEITACDSFALGRPAIAKPGLANEIKNCLKSKPNNELSWNNLTKAHLPDFINMCFDLKGEKFALARTKQWVKLLGQEYPNAAKSFEVIKTSQCLNEMRSQLSKTSCHYTD